MVDCVIHHIRLRRLSSKTQNSPDELNNLCLQRTELLLIVVILIDKFM